MPQEQTFILNCPHCTGQVECNIEWINRKGECPYCHNKFIIQQPPSGPGPAETAAASREDTQRESSSGKPEVSHDDVIKKGLGSFLSSIFIILMTKQIEGLKDEGVEAMNFYRVCCVCFALSISELISDHFPLPRIKGVAQQVKDVLNRNDSAATLLLNASSAFFDKLFLGSADPKLTQDANGEEMDDMTLVAVYLFAIEYAYRDEFKCASEHDKQAAMQAMRSIARKGMESIENGEHVNWNKVKLPEFNRGGDKHNVSQRRQTKGEGHMLNEGLKSIDSASVIIGIVEEEEPKNLDVLLRVSKEGFSASARALLFEYCKVKFGYSATSGYLEKHAGDPRLAWAVTYFNTKKKMAFEPDDAARKLIAAICDGGDAEIRAAVEAGGCVMTSDMLLVTIPMAGLSDETLRYLFVNAMSLPVRCLSLLTLCEESQKTKNRRMYDVLCNMTTILINVLIKNEGI